VHCCIGAEGALPSRREAVGRKSDTGPLRAAGRRVEALARSGTAFLEAIRAPTTSPSRVPPGARRSPWSVAAPQPPPSSAGGAPAEDWVPPQSSSAPPGKSRLARPVTTCLNARATTSTGRRRPAAPPLVNWDVPASRSHPRRVASNLPGVGQLHVAPEVLDLGGLAEGAGVTTADTALEGVTGTR